MHQHVGAMVVACLTAFALLHSAAAQDQRHWVPYPSHAAESEKVSAEQLAEIDSYVKGRQDPLSHWDEHASLNPVAGRFGRFEWTRDSVRYSESFTTPYVDEQYVLVEIQPRDSELVFAYLATRGRIYDPERLQGPTGVIQSWVGLPGRTPQLCKIVKSPGRPDRSALGFGGGGPMLWRVPEPKRKQLVHEVSFTDFQIGRVTFEGTLTRAVTFEERSGEDRGVAIEVSECWTTPNDWLGHRLRYRSYDPRTQTPEDVGMTGLMDAGAVGPTLLDWSQVERPELLLPEAQRLQRAQHVYTQALAKIAVLDTPDGRYQQINRLRHAAMLGSLDAMYLLGYILVHDDMPTEEPDDFVKSVRERDGVESHRFSALIDESYSRGFGIAWLERAAEREHIDAAIECYKYYFDISDGVYPAYEKDRIFNGQEKFNKMVEEAKGKAIAWITYLAEHHRLPIWQHALALGYLRGELVEQSYERALRWFKAAAAQGYADAIHDVGYMYSKGRGVDKDFDEALRWYHRALAAGSVQACYTLGNHYTDGKGVEQDVVYGATLYKRGAERGQPKCMVNWGNALNTGEVVEQDQVKANEWWQKAAEAGIPQGASNLGWSYLFGRGVERNIVRAEYWLEKAAEKDWGWALFHLAWVKLSVTEERASPDEEAAREYFNKAFRAGFYDHQFRQATQLHYGQAGYPRAPQIGAKLYQWGAENGHIGAMCDYGMMLYRGNEWVKVDVVKAIQYFRQSSEAGYARSKVQLADAYLNGTGVEIDRKRAFKLLEEAVEAGSPEGRYSFGVFYVMGWGCEADSDKGIKLIIEAADAGVWAAMHYAGMAYLKGFHLEVDEEKGKAYLQRAADAGVSLSKQALEDPDNAFVPWEEMAKRDAEAKTEGGSEEEEEPVEEKPNAE